MADLRSAQWYGGQDRELLYVNSVQGAGTVADLDFLHGSSGDQVNRESH